MIINSVSERNFLFTCGSFFLLFLVKRSGYNFFIFLAVGLIFAIFTFVLFYCLKWALQRLLLLEQFLFYKRLQFC